MDWAEMLRSVERFGLSEREANIYLSLLRRGRATARELARDANVDRVLGYRTLDALRARGIVETTVERPRRYAPIAPKQLFERSLRERRASLEADELLALDLAERLPVFAQGNESGAPRFQVLTGASTVYDYLREMVGRTHQDMAVLVTHRGLRESVQYGLQNGLPRFLKGGGRFRLIVESDLRVRGLIARFLQVASHFPKAEIRQLSPQPTRMTVVDGREALLFLVPEARSAKVEEVAVWTDNADFVHSQELYFNAVWQGAGSATIHAPTRPRANGRAPRTAGDRARSRKV